MIYYCDDSFIRQRVDFLNRTVTEGLKFIAASSIANVNFVFTLALQFLYNGLGYIFVIETNSISILIVLTIFRILHGYQWKSA
ncbi:hypothetical protein FB446DRAFT_725531 [Lentinula raphanica]|nr:hypothetical protein FB446DRAFT_725531 [Lentinula raphanica]